MLAFNITLTVVAFGDPIDGAANVTERGEAAFAKALTVRGGFKDSVRLKERANLLDCWSWDLGFAIESAPFHFFFNNIDFLFYLCLTRPNISPSLINIAPVFAPSARAQVNVGLRSYVGPGNTGMLPIAQRVDNRPAFMLERATSTQDRINWHVAQTKSAALETQARR